MSAGLVTSRKRDLEGSIRLVAGRLFRTHEIPANGYALLPIDNTLTAASTDRSHCGPSSDFYEVRVRFVQGLLSVSLSQPVTSLSISTRTVKGSAPAKTSLAR